MRLKKMVIGCVVVMIVITIIAIFSYPFVKRVQHEYKEREKIPLVFSTQFPLMIDDMNYFKIPCTIGGDTLELIVDTKAPSLIKKEDIERYNGEYFGELPISMQNAYKHNEKIRMYLLKKFEIQGQSFGNPIFQSISKNNLIYNQIGAGVLGVNILSFCHWKFSIDKQVVCVYSLKDTSKISAEINGYTQIPYGLHDGKIQLAFSCLNQSQNFTLDLGFSGEVEINNALADSLMKTEPFKIIETLRSDGSTGTILLFEHQKVKWNGIILNDCQLVNIPDVNGSYIGAELMRRFNFILGYGDYVNHTKQNHLYIQPVQGFDAIQSKPFMSKFGFSIKKSMSSMIISAIEQGGVADKEGLRLGDPVMSIDYDVFDTNSEDISGFIAYTVDKDSLVVKTNTAIYKLYE